MEQSYDNQSLSAREREKTSLILNRITECRKKAPYHIFTTKCLNHLRLACGMWN